MSGHAALVAVATGSLVLGLAVGFAGGRSGEDDAAPAEPAGVIAEGELTSAPEARLAVRAERVALPAGFQSRHMHGGPTFNFVDAGTVEIESDGRKTRYAAGGFFFEPARHVHTITVLDDVRLRVVRLLPPGVEATTEVP